jgi:hypothetical protein
VFDVLLFNRAELVLVMERVHRCFWLALEIENADHGAKGWLMQQIW